MKYKHEEYNEKNEFAVQSNTWFQQLLHDYATA